MGKEQFAEVPVDGLSLAVQQAKLRVAQRQALHLGAVAVALQRHQRTCGRNDCVADTLGQSVAVAGGAGQGIRGAAGTQDHPTAGNNAPVGLYAGNVALLHEQSRGRSLPTLYIVTLEAPLQDGDHVGRMVRNGKNPVAPLNLQRAAVFLKECHHPLRREATDTAVEETRVARHVFQHLLGRAGVGHIAAALSGNGQLFSKTVIFFHQQDPQAVFRALNGGEHSGSAPADDDNVIHHLFHRHDTGPRSPPIY